MGTEHHKLEPSAAATTGNVEVLSTTMRIHDLRIEQPAIIAYLRAIDPGKQEIALVHAIQVGVTELMARRAWFLTQMYARFWNDLADHASA